MSYAARRTIPPPRPYGPRSFVGRPYYGPRPAGGLGASAGGAALGGALGAVGGTLGCLLCLSAIGALGLFSCVVAITAYAKQFLDAFKDANNLSGAPTQLQIGFTLLIASLFYVFVSRMHRN